MIDWNEEARLRLDELLLLLTCMVDILEVERSDGDTNVLCGRVVAIWC